MKAQAVTTERYVLGISGTIAFFVAWEIAARAGWLNPVVFSDPIRIAEAFARQWSSGDLRVDFSVTLLEFVLGFGLSTIAGVALGVAMGMYRVVEYACDPFVWFFYSAPLIAFYPLIIIWLGFGFTTVVVVSFLLAFISVAINTMTGVHAVDQQLMRAVRVFGGNERNVITAVVLPSAVPYIVAGMRIGLERALIGVVLGEMFSSTSGLGFRIAFYSAHIRTADVFVALTSLIAIGVIANQLCALAQSRLLAWR